MSPLLAEGKFSAGLPTGKSAAYAEMAFSHNKINIESLIKMNCFSMILRYK